MPDSSSPNPFHPSHILHEWFEKAWDFKSSGDVRLALTVFGYVLKECEPGCLAYIQTLHPMAVCQRVAREFEEAEENFDTAYNFALERYPDVACIILLDWSPLRLDQKRPREAIVMLEKAMEHLPLNDRFQCAKAKAYLGHSQGRVRGRRREALAHQQDAADVLRGEDEFQDLHLDNLIWMLEIWLWSPRARFKVFIEAWKLARTLGRKKPGYKKREVDAVVTFIGGQPAREALRWLAARLT